jgi:hypothetical protein
VFEIKVAELIERFGVGGMNLQPGKEFGFREIVFALGGIDFRQLNMRSGEARLESYGAS